MTGGHFGSPLLAGHVLRICVARRFGIVDTCVLALDGHPDEYYVAVAGMGGIEAAVVDRYTFPLQEKRAPMTVYRRFAPSPAASIVGPESQRDDEDNQAASRPHIGSFEARQRELDLLAQSYGTTASNDPWFDATVAAVTVVANVSVAIPEGLEERTVLVPVPYHVDAPEAVDDALRAIAESEQVEPGLYSWKPAMFPVPGDAMYLSRVVHADETSLREFIEANFAL